MNQDQANHNQMQDGQSAEPNVQNTVPRLTIREEVPIDVVEFTALYPGTDLNTLWTALRYDTRMKLKIENPFNLDVI